MYVYIYIYIYICVYVQTYIYIYIYTHTPPPPNLTTRGVTYGAEVEGEGAGTKRKQSLRSTVWACSEDVIDHCSEVLRMFSGGNRASV